MINSITDQIRFQTADLPAKAESIRTEVRDFLELELSKISPVKRSHSWEAYDPDFSAKLGKKGFIGMTLPTKYGGHGKTFLERYVVVEECLVAGAPTAFHWVADRQSGQLLVKYGTEEQKKEHLQGCC